MKRKNKNNKNKFDKNSINLSESKFVDGLNKRFNMSVEELKKQLGYFKFVNNENVNKYPSIRGKFINYPGQKFLVNEYLNMFFPVDINTKTAITPMYVDGSYGYENYSMFS